MNDELIEIDKSNFTDSLLSSLPDINTYRNNLDKLSRINLSHYSQAEIENIFYHYAGFAPYNLFEANIDLLSGNKLYRTRFNVNHDTEDINSKSTFSYPPINLCKDNGRANLKNRNVFYCSEAAIAAILESKPKSSATGFLGFWRIVCNRSIQCVLFIKEQVGKGNMFFSFAQAHHDELKKAAQKYSHDKGLQLFAMNSFMCKIFSEETSPYSISSWLSNKLFYEPGGVDMLVYPSSLGDTVFNSWAIHPNFVDQYLVLEKVVEFEIYDKNKKDISFSIGRIGTPSMFEIEWRNPNKAEYNEVLKTLTLGY